MLVLAELAGDMALDKPRRKLGAGRQDDMGDLDVLPNVCVQVRALADVTCALRSAAADAVVQAGRAGYPYGLGLVPLPRARSEAVRWLAAAHEWPLEQDADEIAVYGTTAAAVVHVRNEKMGVPRSRRVAVVRRTGQPDLFIAPIEAWVGAWRSTACV